MVIHLSYNNNIILSSNNLLHSNLRDYIYQNLGLKEQDFYFISNGKRVESADLSDNNIVHIIPRLPGGKGGFGSMLRAIGAQIEKTTNREACRDLSGRRLRDINEEKRLKNWIDQQAEREKEAADRKQKKLERLCQKPKHEFKDETYDKERSELPERLEDAITQGLAMASTNHKRKSETGDDSNIKKKKQKKALWIDDDLEGLSDEISSGDEESNDSKPGSSKESEDSNKSGDSKEAEDTNSKDVQTNVKDEEKPEIIKGIAQNA